MSSAGDVARKVLAAIDTTAGHLLAVQWVGARYTQLCSRARFRHLRRVSNLYIPGPVTAGTAGFTDGSPIVTGDATAVAAWQACNDLAGRHIRYITNWYEVEGLAGTNLRLTSPASEGTNAATAYQMIRRYVPLDPAARWISREGVVLQRTWLPLRNMPLAALDYSAPSRPLVGPWPECWAQVSPAPDNTMRLEFYPASGQAETVSYVWWAVPPTLSIDTDIGPTIDDDVLVDGALIDAMRYNASRAANAGNVELAGYWRNEYRAQSLIWERRILEGIRTDRGVDDVTIILQLNNAYYGTPQDIVTARDHVWYGWRP